MKKLMIGAAALALLTACGQSDKPADVKDTVLKELTVRKGDPAKAADALAAMSLTDTGTGVLSFAGKTTDGASATFTDLGITGADDTVKVGSLTLDGLDMDGAAATFGKLTLSNIAVSVPEEDSAIKVGAIELVNPSTELAGWIAGTLNGQEVPFPAADKVVFDSWSVTGLTGEFSEDGSDGTFGIDKIQIRDMVDLKAAKAMIGGITLDAFDTDSGMDVKAKLGSVTVNNLDAKFVKAIQENAGDEDAMMAAIMDVAYENPMDPGYDSVKMEDLSFDVAGASFALPELVASVQRNAAGQPTRYVTKPYTMTLKADAEGGEAGAALLQGLSVVGYEELTLKGESVADYDPDKDILSFKANKNYLELVDGAKFSFGGKIEGYNAYTKATGDTFNFADLAEGAEPDPAAMQAALGELTFHDFELAIKDNSLLDRSFNAAATMNGMDPAQMKMMASMGMAMLPSQAEAMGIDGELAGELSGALSKWLSDGGTLTLKMAPKTPLNVGALMENPDPSALTKEGLGFTATHK